MGGIGQHLLRLQEEAPAKRLLVSTSTLIATLRTISYVWQQEEQRRTSRKSPSAAASSTTRSMHFWTSSQNPHPAHPGAVFLRRRPRETEGRQGALYQAEQMRELGVNVKARIPEEFTADLPSAPLELPEEPTEPERT